MDQTLGLLRDGYPRIAPQLLAPFFEVLIAARESCGGDMESFLILLTVALRMVEHVGFATLTNEELLAGAQAQLPGFGTNVRSVADSCGIPRETVRRKVEALIRAGLLERRSRRLFCTSRVFRAFAPVRESLLRMATKNHRLVETLSAGAA